MLNRPFKSVIARIAIFALALSLVVPFVLPAALAQSGASSISYPENGTEAVASFVATDQDGDPIDWELGGRDAGDFTLEGGVLGFKESPDYENPVSGESGTLAERNVYSVTLSANGGSYSVSVTVTNEDEDGSVSLNKPQPQAGRGLEAELSDDDGGVTDEKWQWARSEDGEAWSDIRGATSQTRSPTADDVGSYLRATVTYEDSFGTGKSASAVTDNPVEARTVANAVPSFADQDEDDATTGNQVTREVAENSVEGANIGKSVSASDPDNDILIYTLSGADEASFSISSSTGQLKVKADLDFEDPAQTGATENEYVVEVTATDPSGAAATQEVTITVTDVNEAPKFVEAEPATALSVTENDSSKQLRDGDGNLSATEYEARDNDAGEKGGAVTYSLEGAEEDVAAFAISDKGVLSVDADHSPDYEEKSSYSITIVAQSGAGADLRRARLNVTVNVVDADDAGSVSLSQREPQIGRTVIATVSDIDGGVNVSGWQWERSNATSPSDCGTANYQNIDNANSAAYTPTDDDDKRCLRATVTYTDNIENAAGADDETVSGESERPVQASDPANAAPVFPDQDHNTVGDQSDEASRMVAENAKGEPVGASITATDTDLLQYSVSGADADSFTVDDNGQLKTAVELDYETKNEYMVILTATDPSGASDSIIVNITVTDENDPPVIQEEGAVQQPGSVTLSTDNPAVGEAVTASLSDGNAPVSGESWQWASSSDGETWMDIAGATEASYTPVMDDSGMMLQASVTYTDAVTSGQSASAATANAVNNAPAFGADSASRSIDETAASGANVGAPVAATDVNGDDIAYSLEGEGVDTFSIDSAGQITLAEGASLDYETTTGYSLTVNATDPSGASASVAVAIAVNNQGLDNAYDLDDSGDISKDEAVQAVQDYFADTITRGEVLEVLQLYFAG